MVTTDSIRKLKTSSTMRTEKLCAESPNVRYRACQSGQIVSTNCLDTLWARRLALDIPKAQSLEVKIDAHYQEHPTSFTQDNLCGFYRAS